MFKYITSAILLEDEVPDFIEQLKRFEKLGLSFYFYYMNTLENENERKLCGFSNFAIRETTEGSFMDISDIGDKDIHYYFNRVFENDGYFIVSDNFLKKDSFEEFLFKSISEKKEKGWKPIVIK